MNTFTPRSEEFRPFIPQESVILSDRKKKYITEIVKVNASEIEKTIEVYRWRRETQFPIAKIKTVKLLPSDTHTKAQTETRLLEISFEDLMITFVELTDVPLFRILYLLKQTLIGMQRLFSMFGSFFFTERMIFVDHTGKCKVWINERVEMNEFQMNGLNENEFLAHIFWMFKAKTTQSKQSLNFYEGTKVCNSFFQALDYLESFVERQKIKVLTHFKMPASSNRTTSLEKKKKKIDLNMTISKKPNFLLNMENNSSKEDSLSTSNKDIFGSNKFIPQKVYFSKPEMKISGNTAAESQKNIKSSSDGGSFCSILYSRKALKEKELANSDKFERIQNKIYQARKFSQTNQQSSPIIEIHGPVNFPAPNSQNQIPHEISDSLTFYNAQQHFSRSSSAENKEKLIEKKKEVFNFNGWQLKVNSLFSNDAEYQKSFCEKNEKLSVKRQLVKLDLLDKCATNMCESFMEDSNGEKS